MNQSMHKCSAQELAHRVIDVATRVHRDLGTGLTQSAYEEALQTSLTQDGLQATSQAWIPLQLRGFSLNCGAVADLLVDDCLIVKFVMDDVEQDEEEEALLSCLQTSGKRMGLLMDFSVPLFSDGVKMLALWEPSQVLN
jgi:GxxExxY protein